MMKHFICTVALAAVMAFDGAAQDFEARDITVYNTEAGISLGGTLTLPARTTPKAALVLASGSGTQNRDEEVMGHKPFKAIAEFLSANGYAVLRLDDRGAGESQGDPATSTSDDYAGDLDAAFRKIDSCVSGTLPKGVLGHSEGGSVAIKMAKRNPQCAFIITMGAPAWPGDSIIMSQARAAAVSLTGRWDGESRQRRLMDLVKSPMPDPIVCSMLYMELASQFGNGALPAQAQQQLTAVAETMSSPSYRSIVKYDPADDIRRVAVPWLALNGEKDTQVLPGNLDTIKELNPKADTRLLPGHNHLMQHCVSGMVQEYASIAEDISPEVLTIILQWLDKNVE